MNEQNINKIIEVAPISKQIGRTVRCTFIYTQNKNSKEVNWIDFKG